MTVVVLLDWQNVYKGAREAFGLQDAGHVAGNVDPLALARHLARAADPSGVRRDLAEVRIYRGMPDSSRDPKTYSAFRSQVAAWEHRGEGHIRVRSRKLKYPPRHVAGGRPREKGIDVWLAVDLVEIAIHRGADRAVIFSTDTDLIPALTLAAESAGSEFVEVAAWEGPGRSAPLLRLPDHRIAHHALPRGVYDRLHDPADYNVPKSRREESGGWEGRITAEGRKPRRR